MEKAVMIHLACNESGRAPFEDDDMNESYESLSYYCKEKGIGLYVASEDSYDDGICMAAWKHENNHWEKEERIAPKILFLKITPSRMKYFVDDAQMHGIRIVNNPLLDEILNDKMKTHLLYPEISPFSIRCSHEEVLMGMRKIQLATLHSDLDPNEVFLKPLSLSGGEGIRIIRDFSDMKGIKEGNYILQPRIRTNKRFRSFEIIGNYDCRIVMHNSSMIQCYLRISDSLITNVAKGGRTIYIPTEQIPAEINEKIRMIDKRIEDYGNRIYTIDFVIGESGRFWLIEMNAQPAISWKKDNDQKIREAKTLQQHYASLFSESLA